MLTLAFLTKLSNGTWEPQSIAQREKNILSNCLNRFYTIYHGFESYKKPYNSIIPTLHFPTLAENLFSVYQKNAEITPLHYNNNNIAIYFKINSGHKICLQKICSKDSLIFDQMHFIFKIHTYSACIIAYPIVDFLAISNTYPGMM